VSADEYFPRKIELSDPANSSTSTTEDSRRSGDVLRGTDPPCEYDGDGQRNILTISGASQHRSSLDPNSFEVVEKDTERQHTRDHNCVTEGSKIIRLALRDVWSGLCLSVGAGFGLALLLASGWFIGLTFEPMNSDSIQQHLILPPSLWGLGGSALEIQHHILMVLLFASRNLRRDANESPPSTLSVLSTSFSSNEGVCFVLNDSVIDVDFLSLQEVGSMASGDDLLSQVNKPVADDADTDELSEEIMVDDSIWATEIVDETDDDLQMPSSRTSLSNDATPVDDDAFYDDPSSTFDRVSEGDERVVYPTPTTAHIADSSLMPTSSTTIDTNDMSSVIELDSDSVYVSEGDDYFTNGNRFATIDSQSTFGFVRTHGGSALLDLAYYLTIYLRSTTMYNRNRLTFPYFGSLKE